MAVHVRLIKLGISKWSDTVRQSDALGSGDVISIRLAYTFASSMPVNSSPSLERSLSPGNPGDPSSYCSLKKSNGSTISKVVPISRARTSLLQKSSADSY